MGDHTHDQRAAIERQRRTVESGHDLLVSIRRMIAMLEGPPDGEPDGEPLDVPVVVFTVLAMADEIARLEDEVRRLEGLVMASVPFLAHTAAAYSQWPDPSESDAATCRLAIAALWALAESGEYDWRLAALGRKASGYHRRLCELEGR